MRVYVSGPMRGYPSYNFPAFDSATVKLRLQGYEVVSPTERDRDQGIHEDTPEAELDLAKLIIRDVQDVTTCDAIYMLKGWEKSTGANVEYSTAVFLGLQVMYE